jgi:hypothetical protein
MKPVGFGFLKGHGDAINFLKEYLLTAFQLGARLTRRYRLAKPELGYFTTSSFAYWRKKSS